jgi:hypothetical protein
MAKKANVKKVREREREIVLRVSIPALETSRLIPFSKSSVPLIGNYFLTHDKTRSEFLCFFVSLSLYVAQSIRRRGERNLFCASL